MLADLNNLVAETTLKKHNASRSILIEALIFIHLENYIDKYFEGRMGKAVMYIHSITQKIYT